MSKRQNTSPRARLREVVGSSATALLEEAEAITPEELVGSVRGAHAKLVLEVATSAGEKLLKSMAKSVLKRRADQPLQQELDLGIPDGWTLRIRREDGSVMYVLAANATEDDLVGAEEERKYQLKQAEARLANADAGAQRSVERARAELDRVRKLLELLGDNGRAF